MTIELAVSGLSMTLFCSLITILLIGLSIVIGASMVYGFVRSLTFLIKHMKGGILELRKESKSLMLDFEN